MADKIVAPAEGEHKPLGKTVESQPNLAGIVEKWFADHFHDTSWAGNGALYNKLHEAKEDLKRRFGKEV